MENTKNWAARVVLFLPFLLPLVFMRKVPIVHWEQPRWVLVAILYVYALPPMLDLIGGNNRINNHPDRESWTTKAFEYLFLPRVLFVKVLLLKFLMVKIVATGRFDIIDVLGIAYLTGQSISSYGIFVAHELLHRKSRIDKMFAEIMMVSVMYPHFCIEHLYGHHRYAATPRDPATARFGETLYAFFPRTIFCGILSAWQVEAGRLERRGYHWFNYRNQMIRYGVEVLALLVIVSYFFGILGLTAFVVQSCVAIMAFEVINYVQHYGLMRKEIAPGLYENTGVAHSWNSECWFSNGYWLNLGRHSDHHYVANRSFEMLRNFKNEPELPAGFPAMFLLAFVPPLWFRVMNPRVEAVHRARLLQRDESSLREYQTSSHLDPEPGYGGWRSSIVDGSGVLMGFSIFLLLGMDLVFGYPVGLMTLGVMCLCLVAARYLLTHKPYREAHSGPVI